MGCKFCNSENAIKYGKCKDKQWYFCKNCNRKFLDNGNFARMRIKSQIIVAALDMYFEGLSVRKIQRQVSKLYQVYVSQVTVWKWVIKFSSLVKNYVDELKPKLSFKWHVDETMINCEGEYKWFWEIIDEKTKFMVATLLSEERTIEEAMKLFKQSKERSLVKPEVIVSDGLAAYEEAIKKVFLSWRIPHTTHISSVGLKARQTNNVIERLHGTLKDRLKPMRGLKKTYSANAILSGWFVYYNFLRPHETLDGVTPAEVCGIKFNFTHENGWFDLIDRSIKKNYEGIELPENYDILVRQRYIQRFEWRFIVKIFDKNGREIINPYGMKTKFTRYDIAVEFVKFYKDLHPSATFTIVEKIGDAETEIFRI